MNALQQLQEDIYFRLLSDGELSPVSMLLQRKLVLESDIAVSLGTISKRSGKMGACVVVLMPGIDVPDANGSGPQFDIVCTVRVLEAPLYNGSAQGTGIAAEALGLRVLHLLHHFHDMSVAKPMLADRRAMEPYTAAVSGGAIGYDISVRTSSGIKAGDKVLAPRISQDGSAIALSCGTPGAVLYYTLDGSYPGSGNPAALAYGDPFQAASGTQVRAGAQHDGLVPSDPAQLIVIL